MIGTNEEAQLIAEWPLSPEEAPPGWRILGEGTFRRAYLSPSEVVYKKELFRIKGVAGNRSEDKNLRKAVEISVPGWRIPEHHLFETEEGVPIMAMEYVIGTFMEECYCDTDPEYRYCECSRPSGKCIMDILNEPYAHWGLTDTHQDNVIVEEDGTYALIDAGN